MLRSFVAEEDFLSIHREEITGRFERGFNHILVYEPNSNTQLCANQREEMYPVGPELTMSDAPDYPHTLKFALITYYGCRGTMIRECSNPACIATMDDLKLVMPPCPTWTGLEQWVLQVGACFCSGEAGNLSRDVSLGPFNTSADLYPKLAPDNLSCTASGKPADFVDWARQVNHREVTLLLSWLFGLFLGTYADMSMANRPNTPSTFMISHDRAIAQAMSRARRLHLCPHRTWAIAFSMPGAESNIPALVPDKHLLCSYKHDYCSSGLSHKNCTYDYCHISAVNFTTVVQCHRPNCDGKCQKKVFPVHLLDQAANENRPTAWSIDGKLHPLQAGERYMAISHVWSDGTGGSGSVNKCMYDFFCDVARKLECKGLWWDAICIPEDKHARARAINHMHEYYSQAACTIVHDTCLAMSEWVDGNHASLALVMSNWFTRGWTALELARSKQVEVLFGTRGRTGYVLKNLDVDIVSGPEIVSSLSRQVASTAIQSLRKTLWQSEARYSLDDVLIALGPRFTSWARDRAIIAGQFVGIETLADDQYTIYQQVVCKIGKISLNHLFHHTACPPGPFAWLPSSLFELPVSRSYNRIDVLEDGGLHGNWGIIQLPINFQFSWDIMHPMLRCDVREALNDDRHVVLFEYYEQPITRGLLVKVMKDTNPSYDVLCRYVGPVHFTVPLSLVESHGPYRQMHSVLISSNGADLDTGVSVVDHLKNHHLTFWSEKDLKPA